jgi:hypothetical protein
MPTYHRGQLTPQQRAALVGWHLALGEGLDLAALRALTQLRTADVLRLLERLCAIAELRQDAAGCWYFVVGSPVYATAAHLPQQRGAAVGMLFALRGEVQTGQVARAFGVTRQDAYRLLATVSGVLPVYALGTRRGVWGVCALCEEEP